MSRPPAIESSRHTHTESSKHLLYIATTTTTTPSEATLPTVAQYHVSQAAATQLVQPGRAHQFAHSTCCTALDGSSAQIGGRARPEPKCQAQKWAQPGGGAARVAPCVSARQRLLPVGPPVGAQSARSGPAALRRVRVHAETAGRLLRAGGQLSPDRQESRLSGATRQVCGRRRAPARAWPMLSVVSGRVRHRQVGAAGRRPAVDGRAHATARL